jgi:hypothetical protein
MEKMAWLMKDLKIVKLCSGIIIYIDLMQKKILLIILITGFYLDI